MFKLKFKAVLRAGKKGLKANFAFTDYWQLSVMEKIKIFPLNTSMILTKKIRRCTNLYLALKLNFNTRFTAFHFRKHQFVVRDEFTVIDIYTVVVIAYILKEATDCS